MEIGLNRSKVRIGVAAVCVPWALMVTLPVPSICAVPCTVTAASACPHDTGVDAQAEPSTFCTTVSTMASALLLCDEMADAWR
jgi:hypothetical protein